MASQHNDVQYRPVEDAEPLEKYEPGGYHPVQLGDRLSDGRYAIVHKLGSGGFSTIWLAHDEKEQTFAAIKIAVASSHQDSKEVEILSRIKSQPENHPGRNLMHILRDSFVHNGPNGTHRCFVSAPGACSLAESKFYSDGAWLFPLESARAIAAQLILAVSFLHSIGVVHGDLHMGNILLSLPDISSLSVEELYDKFGAPKPEPSVRLDGKPIPPNVPPYVLPGVWLGKVCEEVMLSDAHIMVTDFGESWQPSSCTQYHLNIPKAYRAPEALFAEKENQAIGFPADVWALGCIIYGLFAQRDIFECLRPDCDDVFAENIGMLGKPPKKWWDDWDMKHDFFDAQGDWAVKRGRLAEGVYKPLETRVVEYIAEDREGSITAEELRDLLGLLEQMFRWLPEDRAKAKELVNGSWMKKWGLPCLELAQKARSQDSRVHR